jgi:hypothetical protein
LLPERRAGAVAGSVVERTGKLILRVLRIVRLLMPVTICRMDPDPSLRINLLSAVPGYRFANSTGKGAHPGWRGSRYRDTRPTGRFHAVVAHSRENAWTLTVLPIFVSVLNSTL